MAKKCCLRHLKKHLGGSEASEIEKLFIETSLGTRLLTIIHRSATVFDAKRKIALDHSQAFPGMREVRIINLQVQHQGHFYHLSESMTLATAFGEPTRDRFLFSEASICEPDEKVGVDHGTGNVNSVSNHVGRFLLLLPAGQEVSAGPSDGDSRRTAVPLAQFTYEEELLQDHLDDDGSGHVVQALQNGHPLVTDEDLAANPDTPEAGSKETSIPHGTKKRKRVKKEISSVGEQSTIGTDKNGDVVPQNENYVSNVVEMDRSVSADLLLQNEATGNAGSISPKKKRRKLERRMVGNAATDHGLSSAPFEEVVNEDTNPQITLTQQAAPQALEPVDVSGVLSQGENVEVQNQEGTLPPSDACLNEERAADIDGNVRRDDNGGSDEYLVAGQSEDVQCQVMYNNHQPSGTSGNRKEKKKKKKVERRMVENAATYHGLSSAPFEEVVNEDVNPQITLTQQAAQQALESVDVSGVLSQGENVEVQNQEGTLPPSDACLNEERAADIDGNVRRDDNDGADEYLVAGQSEDVQGQVTHNNHQQNGISGNRKEKKKTKRSRSSAAEDLLTSGMEEQSHGAEESGAPLMPIHEVGDKSSQSMDVSVSVAPGEGEEALQKQEVLLPLVCVHADHENTAKEKKKKTKKKSRSSAEDIAATEIKELSHGAEGLVAPLIPIEEVGDKTSQSMDVSVSVAPREGEETLQKQEVLLPLVGVHPGQGNTEGLDAKEKQKKKRKKIRSSAAKHGAEGLVASLIPIQEVGDKTTHSVDVSVSVAPSEGEEALQKQEALLPRVDIHPDHVNTQELDGNAREVESATDDPVVTKPIVEDQLVRDQEKGSNLMKEKKIETGNSDVSKVAKDADDQIDFLKYFMPAKSPFEIKSSVNVKGTSQSIKQKKVKGQLDTASSTLSETQESRKSQDAPEANDKKLEQSAEPKKNPPLKNKKLSKPSQDGAVAQISALEKGKKTATSGPAVAVQNSKIAKQQQALNRNAMSTAGKGSNGRSLLKSSGKANSLFNPERKLFTDSESESSSGENKSTNSDASTLPPSRSSSSSSDSSSDSESDASQTSIRKGTATKTSNGTGKSVSSKKRFPNIVEMSMDDVFTRSSRFKKAKLTASQSQEPDSQA